jgi:hypothetical protein
MSFNLNEEESPDLAKELGFRVAQYGDTLALKQLHDYFLDSGRSMSHLGNLSVLL